MDRKRILRFARRQQIECLPFEAIEELQAGTLPSRFQRMLNVGEQSLAAPQIGQRFVIQLDAGHSIIRLGWIADKPIRANPSHRRTGRSRNENIAILQKFDTRLRQFLGERQIEIYLLTRRAS